MIARLARGVAGRLGDKVGIAPRLFLRRLVNLLDRVEEFDDFEPARDFELVLQAGELTPEEAVAAGVERRRRRHRARSRRRRRRRAMSAAFERLSPALQYQIVNGLGYVGLRPMQEAAIPAILDGDNCVVLAPTAGGKTEAAFFPLLSQMTARAGRRSRSSTWRRSARSSTTWRRGWQSYARPWSGDAPSSGTATWR